MWLQNQNQGHFSSQGPSEIQRQRMQEIANAPPHLRQAMLQRLMQQQLGEPVPPTPTAPLSLAQLPRSEQQAVVQQLMARMTPQQRHSLLELPTQQQAIFLQQYYQQHVMPARQVAPVLPPQPAPLSAMGPPPFPAISRAPPVQAPSRGQDVIVRPLLAEEELLFLEREPQMRALLSRLSPQQRQQFGELNPDAQRFFLVQLYKEHELKRQPPVSAANPPPQTQFGPASVASAPNSTYNLPMLPSATGGPIGQVPPQTQPLAPAPGWAGVGAPASTAAPMAPTMPAPAPAPVPAPAPAPPAMPPAIPGASGQGSLTAVVTQPGSMSAPATGILSGGRPSFTMLGSAREPITMPNIFPEAGAVPAQGPAGPAALMGPVITEAGVVGSKDGLFLDGAGLGDDVAQDDLNEAMEYFLN